VRTGARDDTPQLAGVSHFLEHMCFKGTEKRTSIQINVEFDEMGAQYNAFTSRDRTFYYGWVRAEDFGLLFYDTRSTRLTFVRSGDFLDPPPFTGAKRYLRVRPRGGDEQSPVEDSNGSLGRLLDDLIAKGLVVAAEAE
jgi:hypothetical protein